MTALSMGGRVFCGLATVALGSLVIRYVRGNQTCYQDLTKQTQKHRQDCSAQQLILIAKICLVTGSIIQLASLFLMGIAFASGALSGTVSLFKVSNSVTGELVILFGGFLLVMIGQRMDRFLPKPCRQNRGG